MVEKGKRANEKRILIGIIIIVAILSLVLLVNLKVSYTAKVIYDVQERYIDYEVENYYEVVDKTDCDYQTGCYCIKKGFWSGLVEDYCVRCNCKRTKTVPVEKYRTVQETKEEIRECPLFKKILKQCENQVD